jgi:hypothetical protein
MAGLVPAIHVFSVDVDTRVSAYGRPGYGG